MGRNIRMALKAYRNVNEVITSIMLNYVAVFLVNFLVVATVFNQTRNESLSPTNAFHTKRIL
jgi:general nucleoside transport system permease protein